MIRKWVHHIAFKITGVIALIVLPLYLLIAIGVISPIGFTALSVGSTQGNVPVYLRYYPYVNYVYNQVQWFQMPQVGDFFSRFGVTVSKRLTVLHIGDSHIQADVFTGHIREQLQATFGEAGRGLVFPYDAANTHSTLDYKTEAYGKWLYAKNINQEPKFDLGISGITIYTRDTTAGFKFIFKHGIIRSHFKKIKIYCRTAETSFDLLVKTSAMAEPIVVSCTQSDVYGMVDLVLPVVSDTFEFSVLKRNDTQRYFECYGISIESVNEGGVLYNSVGINGAGLRSILKQNLMHKQLQIMRPDMVIIDLGANDFYQTEIDTNQLEQHLVQIIQQVREALPRVTIMLSNSQDILCKTPQSCAIYSALTRKVAFKYKCLFYDYYNICGGKNALQKWSKDSLVKKDMIHLTKGGYQLKGELYLNGILNSYQTWLANPDAESYIIETVAKSTIDTLRSALTDSNRRALTSDQELKRIFYKVQADDVLSRIARKYGVKVSDLLKWNNLDATNKIRAGKTLIIYTYTEP